MTRFAAMIETVPPGNIWLASAAAVALLIIGVYIVSPEGKDARREIVAKLGDIRDRINPAYSYKGRHHVVNG